ncbi:4Fe-4S binding protein [bacterium]|nr:4Fe-4S binding protein [bacterium]QQR59516.1 MAG: 4Fe-4S binding protein [Candidatus Melainabacteria bacterium]
MINQHVIDPESCIGCSACEMACPQNAVISTAGRFCIDFDLCKNCGKCILDCPTDACNSFVKTQKVFTLDEQCQWHTLPLS